jgi:hypothetical protein
VTPRVRRLGGRHTPASGKPSWHAATALVAWARKAQTYLAFRASLSPEEQRQVLSPDGLPFSHLEPKQQGRYLHMLLISEGSEVMAALLRMHLRLGQATRVSQGKGQPIKALSLWLTYAEDARMVAQVQIAVPLPAGDAPAEPP